MKGHTLTASTEIGKAFRLGASAWSLEPRAQLIYQYSDFDDSTLGGTTKTKVKLDTADAFTARVGLRLKADYDTRHGKIQPYGRVNLWQGPGRKTKPTSAMRLLPRRWNPRSSIPAPKWQPV